LGLALLSLAAVVAPGGNPVSLSEVLRPAEQPQVMRFKEAKHLAILDQTLTSSGVLRFVPPDTLTREMAGPSGMTYRIEGSQLSVSKGGQVIRQLDLQANPQLAGFALSLRALLKADIQTLQQHYDIQLTGSEVSWKLQLTPRDDPVSRLIERISIAGGKQQIHMIDSYETGGDSSHMILLPDE
jgi:hypothetical protein